MKQLANLKRLTFERGLNDHTALDLVEHFRGTGVIVRSLVYPGLVIEVENGTKVYFAGDTCVFGDMQLIGRLYEPDVAILPIGDLFTMGPFQAAHAVRLLGEQEVIGGHWGTFPALTGTPAGRRWSWNGRQRWGITRDAVSPVSRGRR